MGHVEQGAGALGRHQAHRRLRGVALGIEHNHRAILAAQILGDGRNEVAGLALLNRSWHGGVLTAHLRMQRHWPERVHERPRAGWST